MSNGPYDTGGFLPSGIQWVRNMSGKPMKVVPLKDIEYDNKAERHEQD